MSTANEQVVVDFFKAWDQLDLERALASFQKQIS